MKLASGIAIVCIVVLALIAGLLIFDIGRQPPEAYVPVVSPTNLVASTTPTVSPMSTPSQIGTTTATSTVTLSNIKPNAAVLTPLNVKGVAPGSWFFEAQLLVNVVDANGNILGSTGGRAVGDWMTTKPVAFTATINFSTSTTKTGSIVVHKDNPSGDPARDQSVSIPITFSHYIQ